MGCPTKSSTRKLIVPAASIPILVAILFSFYGTPNHSSSDTGFRDDNKQVIPIVGAVGPESFAFDPNGGGPYTGVSDGRIIKWHRNESRWVDFAVTSPERNGCGGGGDDSAREHICGRPLGLHFDKKNGHLMVADAYMGLLAVTPNGGIATPVAKQAEGVPFGFTNSLDIDQATGVVFFTDSSTKYQRRNYISAIVSGDDTGRLMKYDPETNQISVILRNLKFPNGVSLSKDADFLLIAETTTCRILKLWLKAPKTGEVETIAQLPGFPDNIKRNHVGEFWVGVHSRRKTFLKWALSKSWVGNALVKLPFDLTKAYSYVGSVVGGYGFGVRMNGNGDVLEVLEGVNGRRWKYVSEIIEEEDGNLWIGSVKMPFAVKENIST
nr:protein STRICTOSIDINE SYNTHASE-LIKE 2-like [Ipomoea batatas]